MRNFGELKYNASMQTALEIAKQWLDAKPDNKQLQELVKCLTDVYFFVHGLNSERQGFDMVVDKLLKEKSELQSQLEDKREMFHESELNEKFARETSDDINERLNNIL